MYRCFRTVADSILNILSNIPLFGVENVLLETEYYSENVTCNGSEMQHKIPDINTYDKNYIYFSICESFKQIIIARLLEPAPFKNSVNCFQ